MQKTPKIILMLDSSRAADRGMIRGIMDYATQRGSWSFYRHSPLFLKAPFSPSKQDDLLARLRSLDADGIIGYLPSSRTIQQLLIQHRFPAVTIPLKKLIPGIVNVLQDPAIGALGAKYLRDLGFEHFAFCGQDNYWSQVRQEGFTDYLKTFQIRPLLFCDTVSRTSIETRQQRLCQWLQSLPKPIGIMTCNDEKSMELVEACREAGLHIPNEIAILGVDNDEMICGLSHPPLSSIELNFQQVGYKAAETLDLMIYRKKEKYDDLIFRPMGIVTRQSTDIRAIHDEDVAEAIRFIHNNAKRDIRVEDVVNATAISVRSLQLRFKKIVGRGISQHIRMIRIQQLAHQSIHSNQPISIIARELDFHDINHVSRIFRREMGISPLEYRKKFRL